jgi:hypothetical protein
MVMADCVYLIYGLCGSQQQYESVKSIVEEKYHV